MFMLIILLHSSFIGYDYNNYVGPIIIGYSSFSYVNGNNYSIMCVHVRMHINCVLNFSDCTRIFHLWALAEPLAEQKQQHQNGSRGAGHS